MRADVVYAGAVMHFQPEEGVEYLIRGDGNWPPLHPIQAVEVLVLRNGWLAWREPDSAETWQFDRPGRGFEIEATEAGS